MRGRFPSMIGPLSITMIALWACTLGGSSSRSRHCDAEANCEGRECGPDQCGGDGQCGVCDEGMVCQDDRCVLDGPDACTPHCAGRECGPDGCAGSCGDCPTDWACNETFGTCYDLEHCVPQCEGRYCGWDQCEGTCGTCPVGWTCDDDGECVDPGDAVCDPITEDHCLDCGELLSCFASCLDSDPVCVDGCYASATEEAASQMEAMYTCLDFYCSPELDDNEWATCVDAAVNDIDGCQVEAEPCLGGGGGEVFCDPAYGVDCLDCDELMSCLNGCPNGDDGCYDDCTYGSSEEAYGQWAAMWDCLDRVCPTSLSDAEWAACVEEALSDPTECQAQGEPCLGVSEEPEWCNPETSLFCLDCEGMMNCLSACTDDACQSLCLSLTAEEGYDQWVLMWDCFEWYCPSLMPHDDWVGCVNAAASDHRCQVAAEPCLGSSGGSLFCDAATSTTCLDCQGLLECYDSCPEDRPSCIDYCTSRATEEGYDHLVAMWDCLDLWCPDTMATPLWFECIDAAANDFRCHDQAAPCLGD